LRKVTRAVSKTTAIWLAACFCRNWPSMLQKPKTAFTGTPAGLVIGGSAWKARKI